jgi:hypothetical protein
MKRTEYQRMTLKTAAFLAIIGTALWTVLTAFTMVRNLTGLVDGYIPAAAFGTSLIEFLAALSLLIFVATFYRSQS